MEPWDFETTMRYNGKPDVTISRNYLCTHHLFKLLTNVENFTVGLNREDPLWPRKGVSKASADGPHLGRGNGRTEVEQSRFEKPTLLETPDIRRLGSRKDKLENPLLGRRGFLLALEFLALFSQRI